MPTTHARGQASEAWFDATHAELVASIGVERSKVILDHVGSALPAGYDELNWPTSAAVDLPIIDLLRLEPLGAVRTAMLHFSEAPAHEWRFRVYHRGDKMPLADMLPLLDNLGFRALDEQSFVFELEGPVGAAGATTIWTHDVGVSVPPDVDLTEHRRAEVQQAFIGEFERRVEVDGFNRLVLLGGLGVRDAEIIRAYARYLRQIGFPFSQQYIESAVVRHAGIAGLIVQLFRQHFCPAAQRTTEEPGEAWVRAQIEASLDAVPSLDDDRILRALLALVDATVRTNVFRPGDGMAHRAVMAFKFDPAKVPDLPLPRPMHEIWICSPRVEGVHLRGGRIARGGIRWSDRREDFRTEILGLVKAQMVKNAVIVPTGAKGGFVVKRATADAESFRAEGMACYQEFISGLLDLTDDLDTDGTVIAPPETVRRDGDDPYLVVAADKGTATFSDIANAISASYGFWLDDAFASGGSAGYDHKVMGITAKGAWESVRRHARAIGKDADQDPITIVGIGDMSGDVFGNGLLRSPHVRLLAAFDHRHIFLDPNPDPAASFAERARLFALPRSSWGDYDVSLISAGGAVITRSAKSIVLSPKAQVALGAARSTFTPLELISTILRAPVDVLWNGGIGTYVKASAESQSEVMDRANDGLRINGNELRCKLVGEGGNLGFTQRGRIEYALSGGLINTDAIDNSAGVDCSDHEVNIKILLSDVMATTGMTLEARNVLLASMTDEVGELVLDDNRAQTLALAIARRQALPMANVHARYLDVLEAEGWLNRSLEFLPTDKQIAERQTSGAGLTTPEFAVLLAYTKTTNIELIVGSNLPDEPYLEPDLIGYFPGALRERFIDQIRRHRLRREIIATRLGNEMVNISGLTGDHRITEDTGVGVVDISRVWVAARDILDIVDIWAEIDALGTGVKLDTQLELFLEARWMMERAVLWLLRHRRPPIDIAAVVDQFRAGFAALDGRLDQVLLGRMRDNTFAKEASRLASSVPESMAQRSAVWPLMHTSFDVVDLADARGVDIVHVAAIYWQMFERVDASWLWDAIGALPRSDRWQTQARAALRDDLLGLLRDLTEEALHLGSVDRWSATNERFVERMDRMFTEIRRAEHHGVTTLSVALRQLRNLSLTSQRND